MVFIIISWISLAFINVVDATSPAMTRRHARRVGRVLENHERDGFCEGQGCGTGNSIDTEIEGGRVLRRVKGYVALQITSTISHMVVTCLHNI